MPRHLKKVLTAEEVVQLKAYYQRFPFDDESNFHVPMAQLTALLFNIHRAADSKPLGADDFLIFKPHPELDLESPMDREIAQFFRNL